MTARDVRSTLLRTDLRGGSARCGGRTLDAGSYVPTVYQSAGYFGSEPLEYCPGVGEQSGAAMWFGHVVWKSVACYKKKKNASNITTTAFLSPGLHRVIYKHIIMAIRD